jgi:hypothetical protein
VRKTATYNNILSDDALVLKKTALVYDYNKLLALYLVNCTLDYLAATTQPVLKYDLDILK